MVRLSNTHIFLDRLEFQALRASGPWQKWSWFLEIEFRISVRSFRRPIWWRRVFPAKQIIDHGGYQRKPSSPHLNSHLFRYVPAIVPIDSGFGEYKCIYSFTWTTSGWLGNIQCVVHWHRGICCELRSTLAIRTRPRSRLLPRHLAILAKHV